MSAKDIDALRRDPAHRNLSRGELWDRSEDIPSNPTPGDTLGDLVNARYGRREVLKGALATAAIAGVLGPSALAAADAPAFAFDEIAHGVDETHHVAPGHAAEVLIRWGDPVLPEAPPFDPRRQSAAAQALQFGYNCDFIGFLPLPRGSAAADHGLLFVNHEYTNEELMFPGLGGKQEAKDMAFKNMTRELVDIELAAHGASVVEVRRAADGRWSYRPHSPFNRRITGETPIRLSGPAAGHGRLTTAEDPGGRVVRGMLNNCAGGVTPWGTVLSGEENVHGYFWGAPPEGHAEAANHKRYGIPGKWYNWGVHHARFDVGKEANEANRFGWIVEIDPYDPASVPIKRTALGRMKHEGAETILAKDGRLVVYSGDDERFEYVYKFVTRQKVNLGDRAANRDLLDEGTLYVARFDADGKGAWLPLVFGQGPLTPANGFGSQADVLIETRRAADLLGATKMDRPEDVEANPKTGKVYVILTNNSRRTAAQADKANPRGENLWGHIVEIAEHGNDNAAERFAWDILLLAGNPADPKTGARYHPATTPNGWFACPDNCAFDARGRMWVATDQGTGWKKASGTADGLYAVETAGAWRGLSRMFFRVPVGAELCGPRFAADGKTLFLAVQHPAADGAKDWAPFGRESTFEDPATRWPDFKPNMPPRPSVVTVRRLDGGTVGG